MKKFYVIIAILIALVGGLYLLGASHNNDSIVIPEGIQSQFGDLRIGVAIINAKTEYVDSKGNPVNTASTTLPSGPTAKLAISDPQHNSTINVFVGDIYPVGDYKINVKNITLATEKEKGFVTLQITSETDKNPVIIDNVLTIPPVNTEKQIVSYEIVFLDATYGGAKGDWEYSTSSRMVIKDRVYDDVIINLSDRTAEPVHFDVTSSLRLIAKEDLKNLPNITFSKNTGETVKDAIIISGAPDDQSGVDSEYVYLNANYGLLSIDWQLVKQSLVNENGHYYDKMDIMLVDGTEKTIYFDITEFFGKGTTE